MTWLLVLVAPIASAASPTFALDHLEVAVHLPEGGWRLARWSGEALVVDLRHPDGPIRLEAWGTPIQVPLEEGRTWAPAFAEQLDVEPSGPARLDRIGDRQVVYSDLTPRDPSATVRAATLEVTGANLHIAVAGPRPAADTIEDVLDQVLASLDSPSPEPGAFGATVEVPGLKLALPPDWRPLLAAERDETGPSVGSEDCAHAIRPRPAAAPDRLALCPLTLSVGIVDEHTLRWVEPRVREVLDEAGAQVELLPIDDGHGLVFDGGQPLVGVVPHAAGATTLELRGPGVDRDALSALLSGVALTGPHPVSLSNRIWYWSWVRPAPLLVTLTGLGLAIGGIVGLRRARS